MCIRDRVSTQSTGVCCATMLALSAVRRAAAPAARLLGLRTATNSCGEIVTALDQHIVGQHEAKRALAVALRDRWRRKQIKDNSLRAEVFPNNILMSGPTGSGKTECARRLSKIVSAPFVRCEATRFTEVGIVGSTPDSMVKDLADEAVALEQASAQAEVEEAATGKAEDRILDYLEHQADLDLQAKRAAAQKGAKSSVSVAAVRLSDEEVLARTLATATDQDVDQLLQMLPDDPTRVFIKQTFKRMNGMPIQADDLRSALEMARAANPGLADVVLQKLRARAERDQPPPAGPGPEEPTEAHTPDPEESGRQREAMRVQLRAGNLDSVEVQVQVQPPTSSPLGFGSNSDEMSEMHESIRGMLKSMQGGDRPKPRKMTVGEWMPLLKLEVAESLIDMEQVVARGLERCQQDGIIFVDEIDKLAATGQGGEHWAKGDGVQKELLGLLEGTQVRTRHGMVSTEHVLFIAAGAFHQCKPSDLLPELQGRLAVRVMLNALDSSDLLRIVTQTKHNLLDQQIALLATEGIELVFTPCAAKAIADAASEANRAMENIGARRLRTIISKVMEELKFNADQTTGEVVVDAEYVKASLGSLIQKSDMSRYVL
eukprot:TRINITY_DN39347_c0_g1_i2.p1 TRINITY_DN39347_c0_g1~~TRINITY_DN39347_c0_g1_i2.p1  ORF type:complete len:602 (-),score=199.49 TRINITY_DN39347_c0_g1_i2:42-1847(-)